MRKGIFVASGLLLLALMSFVIYGCGTTSSSSPSGLPITFLHAFDQIPSWTYSLLSAEVIYMNSDGSGITVLTDTPGPGNYADSPLMSPDGTKIAYLLCMDTDLTTLEVINVNGSGRQIVSAGIDGYHYFCWSPDSKKLAYVRDGTIHDLKIRNIETMDPAVDVTGEVWTDTGVSWSPDGTKLAFSKNDGSLWIAHLIDTTVSSVEKISSAVSYRPIFSPKDSNIVALRYGPSSYLSILEINSLQVTTLETQSAMLHIFSPDGEWVYYSRQATVDWDIFRVRKNGTDKANLTDDILALSQFGGVQVQSAPAEPYEVSPRFFPGSDTVFFTVIASDWNLNSSEVYSMDPDGSNKSVVTYNDTLDMMGIYELE